MGEGARQIEVLNLGAMLPLVDMISLLDLLISQLRQVVSRVAKLDSYESSLTTPPFINLNFISKREIHIVCYR